MIVRYLIVAFLAIGLGAYLDHKFNASTVVQTVEKEVIRKDIVTVVKVVERPDGTKESTSTTTDRTKEASSSTVKVVTLAPKYHISTGVASEISRDLKPVYMLQVERRFAGPVFVGVNVNSNKQVGLVLGMEF
jgi:ribosomal protein S25